MSYIVPAEVHYAGIWIYIIYSIFFKLVQLLRHIDLIILRRNDVTENVTENLQLTLQIILIGHDDNTM